MSPGGLVWIEQRAGDEEVEDVSVLGEVKSATQVIPATKLLCTAVAVGLAEEQMWVPEATAKYRGIVVAASVEEEHEVILEPMQKHTAAVTEA